MNTATPRVVVISTEGIPRIPYIASGLTNQNTAAAADNGNC